MLERVGLLGDGVELFGEGDDFFQLVDRVDPLGDGCGVRFSCGGKDGFDALEEWLDSGAGS